MQLVLLLPDPLPGVQNTASHPEEPTTNISVFYVWGFLQGPYVRYWSENKALTGPKKVHWSRDIVVCIASRLRGQW